MSMALLLFNGGFDQGWKKVRTNNLNFARIEGKGFFRESISDWPLTNIGIPHQNYAEIHRKEVITGRLPAEYTS